MLLNIRRILVDLFLVVLVRVLLGPVDRLAGEALYAVSRWLGQSGLLHLLSVVRQDVRFLQLDHSILCRTLEAAHILVLL